MSKREIKGLQELALAHGGTLSINPETGLVEAGFLEQILPIVAAAGLTYLTAGAAAPTLTAALGGSAMAGGIAAGALSGAAISGGLAAIQGKDAGKAALMGGLGGGVAGGMGAYDAANLFNAPNLLADTSQQIAAATPDVAATALTEGAKISPTAATPDVSDVYSGLAGQPTVPPGTMPPNISTTAASPALNIGDVEAQAGGFYGGQAPVNPYAKMSNQEIANATGIQTPQTSPTYYSQLKPDQYVQKGIIQALPVAGLLEQEEKQQLGPQDNYVSPLQRISPNFQSYQPPQPDPYYKARYPTYAAEGGIMSSYQVGGSVDDESGMDEARGLNVGNLSNGFMNMGSTPAFNTGGVPKQEYLPRGDAGRFVDSDPSTRSLSAMDAAQYRLKKLMGRSGIKMQEMPKTGIKSLGGDFSDTAARGGVAHLGDYSDGGRLLKGPGDGVSDNIPATIGGKQPARLADGEFVVPARIVSELGNGSTEAGAKRLYAMMDRVQKARKKTVGKGKIAKDSKSSKYLPA
jgi:hypothetical protein